MNIRIKETAEKQCPFCKSNKVYYRNDSTTWECLKCSKWFAVVIDGKYIRE